MARAELEATIERRMTALQTQAITIECNPRETVVPPCAGPSTGGRQAIAGLAERSGLVASQSGAQLVVEGTLGEGGMGIVEVATQTSLGRKVAVKTLRAEHRDESSVLKLLQEAWITGALEHPNVAPIYDLSLSAEGMPMIVLKRIEGVEWGLILSGEVDPPERFGADDLLEYNLRILLQVCHAVHFAHSRQIIHRDLKPENVMVGEFGEVYLLDWGIAVSLRDDGTGRLPLASKATAMAGTPCYMAPEMLGDTPELLSPRTDVYLLGALLYELLTGKPPHDGDTSRAIIISVIKSTPAIPETVPGPLADIIRKAMAAEPEQRFASAEEVRLALEQFLEHRGSAQLAARADERLSELLTTLAHDHDGPEARAEIQNLLGACRFGFRAALEAWPDNRHAIDGQHRLLTAMIEHELSNGHVGSASSLLAELSDAPPSLRQRVQDAVAAHEREQRRVRNLDRDLDKTIGQRTRRLFGVVLCLVWSAVPLTQYLMGWGKVGTYARFNIFTGVYFALAAGLAIWARDSLSRTRLNRQIVRCVLFVLVAQAVLSLGSWIGGVPFVLVGRYAFFLWFCMAGTMTILVDRRLALCALGYLAGFLIAIQGVAPRYLLMGASHLILLINVLVVWESGTDTVAPPRSQKL